MYGVCVCARIVGVGAVCFYGNKLPAKMQPADQRSMLVEYT